LANNVSGFSYSEDYFHAPLKQFVATEAFSSRTFVKQADDLVVDRLLRELVSQTSICASELAF